MRVEIRTLRSDFVGGTVRTTLFDFFLAVTNAGRSAVFRIDNHDIGDVNRRPRSSRCRRFSRRGRSWPTRVCFLIRLTPSTITLIRLEVYLDYLASETAVLARDDLDGVALANVELRS